MFGAAEDSGDEANVLRDIPPNVLQHGDGSVAGGAIHLVAQNVAVYVRVCDDRLAQHAWVRLDGECRLPLVVVGMGFGIGSPVKRYRLCCPD